MKEQAKILKEEQLYEPIRDFFIKQGFEVKGEVEECDVIALKEDSMIIIELKLSLNLEVILQAALRQKLTDYVYIAVPKKYRNINTKKWKDTCYLLRRLHIGLLLISVKNNNYYVEEVLQPVTFDIKKSKQSAKKKKEKLVLEFNNRKGDHNNGGINRRKIITAYREQAIHIAVLMQQNGELTIKQLIELGTDEEKTGNILRSNFYGWFERVNRGCYKVTAKGIDELENYKEIVKVFV